MVPPQCKLSLSLITVISTPPSSLLDPLRGPRSQLSHVRIFLLFPRCFCSSCWSWRFGRRNVGKTDRWANVQHLLVQRLLFIQLKFFSKGIQFCLKLIFIKLLMLKF